MSTQIPQITEPTLPSQPRRRRIGPWLWALVGLILLAGGFAAVLAIVPLSTDTAHQAFDGPVNRVVIEVTGKVAVTAADTTEVTMTRKWSLLGAPTTKMELDNGVLHITADCSVFRLRCTTDVNAAVPADAEVLVDTSAGGISVTGAVSGVDLTTSAGSVEVEDVSGGAMLRSSAGSIRGTLGDGDVDAETSAGAIDLDVSGSFQSLSAQTSAGFVDLKVPDRAYRVDAETSAGRTAIGVTTNPDSPIRIFARSSAGSITIGRMDRP